MRLMGFYVGQISPCDLGHDSTQKNASNQIRTDDLHITSVAPYQLGHRSLQISLRLVEIFMLHMINLFGHARLGYFFVSVFLVREWIRVFPQSRLSNIA